MHLFIELFTFGCFVAVLVHAAWCREGEGLALFGSLVALGFVRENAVVLRGLLYGFAPLHLMLGKAPLIATIIWGFSIYAALVWAQEATGGPIGLRTPSVRVLGAVALFMIALACFYEPFLRLIGMARWQEGTRATLGVPWIAVVGYPTLAVAFLALWGWAAERGAGVRFAVLVVGIPALALGHAFGLQAVKRALGW